MKICLIGFQGAGKTAVGRWIASKLSINFFDLDDMIQKHHSSSSIRDVFVKLGEEAFRKEEAKCLQPILTLPSFVVALGGGAVEALQTVPEDVHIIYLFRPLGTLEDELQPPYPLWIDGDDPLSSMKERWEERHPLYFQRATAVVLVEKTSVEDDARQVLQTLQVVDGQQ